MRRYKRKIGIAALVADCILLMMLIALPSFRESFGSRTPLVFGFLVFAAAFLVVDLKFFAPTISKLQGKSGLPAIRGWCPNCGGQTGFREDEVSFQCEHKGCDVIIKRDTFIPQGEWERAREVRKAFQKRQL